MKRRWYGKTDVADCHLVWVDTETGGLDPARAALLELAVIVTDLSGHHVTDRYEARLQPIEGDSMTPGALKVNGYDPALWLETAKPFNEVMDYLHKAARSGILAGHNTRFDGAVIRRALTRRGYGTSPWPGRSYQVDTSCLSWPLLAAGRIRDLKLGTIAEYLGIPNEAAHRAMGDAETARLVYLDLMHLWGAHEGALP